MSENTNLTTVVLGVGANCGDRARSVAKAISWISEMLEDSESSSIYETPAYGHAGGPYMNAVVRGVCPAGIAVERLERECKLYEAAHGRDAESRRQKIVPIDIDIVMAGADILRPADFGCSFFQIGFKEISEKGR